MLAGETSEEKLYAETDLHPLPERSDSRLSVKKSPFNLKSEPGVSRGKVIRFTRGAVKAAYARSASDTLSIYSLQKRIFDLAVSIGLLVVLAPVIGTVALLVHLTSRGPIVFKQKRLTIGGRVFTMYKFRTMRIDAEAGTGAVWASNSDPRVTPIGLFLRRTRLDELPQLINVLSGDMSLIGPRPERPEFAQELSDLLPNFHRRLEVPAGITGLAQVSSGYAACIESYRKKLAFDLLYVKKRSLLLDLQIAVKTIAVIITGTGAR